MLRLGSVSLIIVGSLLLGCSDSKVSEEKSEISRVAISEPYYGTLNPFASEAVYFLMTDRFVDGDISNNYPEQGGVNKTFNRPLTGENGQQANVGYLGGDFKGILDNAKYISDMGFTSIWLSPVVDNPDEAFAGGEVIEFGGAFKDGGKTGYHGYWGVNFFKIDEHWPSKDLSFKQLTDELQNKYQIKTILDVVANHGSPSFAMSPVDQPMYGEIYNAKGELLADHQNLEAGKLDSSNPLHQFYNHKTEIVQLSDIDENNPEALEYFTEAYLYWIEQGADAFRVDTLKHMPHSFWKSFADNIRAKHPTFFMFGESYSFDEKFIAEHTLEENGDISVLDFPGQKAITAIFENSESDFKDIQSYLYLKDAPYKNVYELMTFYDNHDMQRMNASADGFIDAHNWLFTSRGIPVVYYGSEIAFMAGTNEHMGNRNYFGNDNIKQAKSDSIHNALTKVANIRKSSVALQKGLQVNIEFKGNTAIFFRVYEYKGEFQTALILLNKGDKVEPIMVDSKYLSEGDWKDAFNGRDMQASNKHFYAEGLSPHSVSVYLLNSKNNSEALKFELNKLVNEL